MHCARRDVEMDDGCLVGLELQLEELGHDPSRHVRPWRDLCGRYFGGLGSAVDGHHASIQDKGQSEVITPDILRKGQIQGEGV